eukprot:3844774-Ditylum_brightwellii.AAC.1
MRSNHWQQERIAVRKLLQKKDKILTMKRRMGDVLLIEMIMMGTAEMGRECCGSILKLFKGAYALMLLQK